MTPDLFQRELIIDHYKNPRHKGLMDAPHARHQVYNPFCGDDVTIDLKVADGLIVDAAFDGRGCSISQAAASMLVDEVIGASIEDAATWEQQFVLDLLGIEIGPVRLKCALLPLNALQGALRKNQYSAKNGHR